MTRTVRVVVASTLCLAGTAHAEWVGGALVTTPEWNQAASEAIGETATVFRMFMAFDSLGDGVNSIGQTFLDTSDGSLLFQDEYARDRPPTGDFDLRPTYEWDSYVSGGNLTGPTRTLLDPSFHFSPTGLYDPAFNHGSGWLAIGGWTDEDPENIARAPGASDQNGNLVIPEHFDDRYLYSFQAQFTVLGIDVQQDDPIFDGGFVHTDHFAGSMYLSWSRHENPSGFLTHVEGIVIGSAGAAAPSPAAGITLAVFAAVRRRRGTAQSV